MTDDKDKCRNVKNKMFFIWLPEKMKLKNMMKFYHLIILYIYIYIYIYIYTTNLLHQEQECLMMFNERYSFERYFFHYWAWLNIDVINLLYWKNWTDKIKYIPYLSVTHRVLKSCRSEIATLAHDVCDVHGGSSLYIKTCWQSLCRVFSTGRVG